MGKKCHQSGNPVEHAPDHCGRAQLPVGGDIVVLDAVQKQAEKVLRSKAVSADPHGLCFEFPAQHSLHGGL